MILKIDIHRYAEKDVSAFFEKDTPKNKQTKEISFDLFKTFL